MQGQTITRSIRYHVTGSTGDAYVVTVDPRDTRTACSCPAGSFGKDCKHQRAVRNGEAGRPIVRCTTRPAPRTVSVSPAMRDFAAALEL